MRYRHVLLASFAALVLGFTYALPTHSDHSASSSPVDVRDVSEIIKAKFESSAKSREWAKDEDLADAVIKHANRAYFWSGSTTDKKTNNRVSVMHWASKYAQEHGGMTLEMVLHDMQNDHPEHHMVPLWNPNDQGVFDWWGKASVALASGVEGTVHVVLGKQLRPNSIWLTQELPALKENENVKKIIAVEGFTGKTRELWPNESPDYSHADGKSHNNEARSSNARRDSDTRVCSLWYLL